MLSQRKVMSTQFTVLLGPGGWTDVFLFCTCQDGSVLSGA